MAGKLMEWEKTRAAELLEAQSKAVELFNQIEARELIRPGITEKDLNADIYALAKEMFGINTY
jgi:Xaa-Pro dipeptidase